VGVSILEIAGQGELIPSDISGNKDVTLVTSENSKGGTPTFSIFCLEAGSDYAISTESRIELTVWKISNDCKRHLYLLV
jgi:hypothetical protein